MLPLKNISLEKVTKIILTDEEEERDYAFTVDGVTNYSAGLYVFMNIDSMRELFGQEDTYFNVVFSDRELSIPSGKLYSSYPAKRLKNHQRFL